jgi:hypothetical protein
MISQFFILSARGDVIIRRDYLGNVPKVGQHLSALLQRPSAPALNPPSR